MKNRPGELIGNVFSDTPGALPEELFTALLVTGSFRVGRIVSRGHSSPQGFWYDQEEGEWVILLQGSAGMQMEGAAGPMVLRPGDYLHIRPHVKHRVDWTAMDGDTIWLAIHYQVPRNE